MTDDELIEQLRDANPFGSTGDLPQPTTSKRARFEEIIMTTPTTTAPRSNPAAAPRFWQNPRLVAPTALAIAAIVAVSALLASAFTAPSASALEVITAAAENVDEFDSGRYVITSTSPDPTVDGELDFDIMFDGDDFRVTSSFSDWIKVGGTVYDGTGIDSDGYGKRDARADDALNPDSIRASAILPILEQAQDFTERGGDDGSTVYSATVSTSVLQGLSESDVPVGLALFVGEDSVETLTELQISVVVEDELLRSTAVRVAGDTEFGPVDITITTELVDLGVPQTILAPDPELVIED